MVRPSIATLQTTELRSGAGPSERPVRGPRRPGAFVAAVVVAFAFLDLWWLDRYRRGGPFNVDETGELTWAAENTAAYLHGGTAALWHSFRGRAPSAPLLAMLAVPFNLVLGRRSRAAFAELVVFFVILVVGSYWTARRLVPPPMAALAAFLVAGLPEVTTWTRDYYTPIAAGALFVGGVTFMLWSDGLRQRWWAMAAGVAFGLALLARGMMVAVVPCAFVGGAVLVVAGGAMWRRRLECLTLAGVLTLTVASSWYLGNLGNEFRYLDTTGAGHWQFNLDRLEQAFLAPLACVIAVAAVLGARTLTVGRLDRPGRWPDLRGSARARDGIALAVIAVSLFCVYVIKGRYPEGEWLPVAVFIVILTVALLTEIPRAAWRIALIAALGGATSVNVAGASGLVPVLGQRRVVVVGPSFLAITDGRSLSQRTAETAGMPTWDPSLAPPPIQRWVRFNHEITAFVAGYATDRGFVPTAFFSGAHPDPFFNPSSLSMDDRFSEHTGMFTGALVVTDTAHALADSRQQLHDPQFGWPNVLLVIDPEVPKIHSVVSPLVGEEAAHLEGFSLAATRATPDGRTVRIWWFPRGNPVHGGARAYLVP